MSNKTTKIKIEFVTCLDRDALEIEANTIKEAVESAVKDGANLRGANLLGTNLRGANLKHADLCCANLESADLSGVNLSGANLRGVNLESANLSGANLSGVNLSSVNLESAVLRYANLYGANLSGAVLRYVNLEDTNLYGAKHNDKELWEVRPVLQFGCCGSAGRSTLVIFYEDKSEPVVYCGCFSGTIEEFEAKIHKTHNGTFYEYEYMAMVEYIRAIRKYQLEEGKGGQQ